MKMEWKRKVTELDTKNAEFGIRTQDNYLQGSRFTTKLIWLQYLFIRIWFLFTFPFCSIYFLSVFFASIKNCICYPTSFLFISVLFASGF